ncbi:hypothetical protein Hte_008070 [Hypoxylon texense]
MDCCKFTLEPCSQPRYSRGLCFDHDWQTNLLYKFYKEAEDEYEETMRNIPDGSAGDKAAAYLDAFKKLGFAILAREEFTDWEHEGYEDIGHEEYRLGLKDKLSELRKSMRRAGLKQKGKDKNAVFLDILRATILTLTIDPKYCDVRRYHSGELPVGALNRKRKEALGKIWEACENVEFIQVWERGDDEPSDDDRPMPEPEW